MTTNTTPKKDNFMRNAFIALLVIVIILLGLNSYQTNKSIGEVDKPALIANGIVNAADNAIGDRSSKVALVEYADFQCPACKAWEPTVKEVIKESGSNFVFVYRYFPLAQIHQNALGAAKAAEAASRQGKFWEMHDQLYANQEAWGSALNASEYFSKYATSIGLDMAKYNADIASKEVEDRILSDMKEGNKAGVQGTPSFYLNGSKLTLNSTDALKKILKETIEAANGSAVATTTTK